MIGCNKLDLDKKIRKLLCWNLDTPKC